jgi:predicted methyltransferase
MNTVFRGVERLSIMITSMILAISLAACSGPSQPEATQPAATATSPSDAPAPPDLTTILASDFRSADDRERDSGRRPADVIAFLGIEPGMRVLDVMAGGGWYTEVLSLAVGPDGNVTSHNTAFALQIRDGANEIALNDRLADGRLPNVSRLNKEVAEIVPEDGPFDAAITAMNLHDIYNRGGEETATSAMASIYSALRPGGVFGVIDHQGLEGQDNIALHRMEKADAIRVSEAAGFVVEADSGILHVHSDDMTGHMRDRERGQTHRFLLKLRKPK